MRSYLAAMLLVALAGPATQAHAEALRVSWGAHNPPPYAIVEREKLTGGIIFVIGEAVSGKLGKPVEFVQVPRARQEAQLQGGRIDVTCLTNPQWLQEPQALLWSPALFEEVDILAQSAGSSPWRDLDDLDGRRIGTIHAFRYPALESLFGNGRALRDDGGSLDGNMRRLALGRLDAVLDAEIPIRWWLRENPLPAQPTFSVLTVSQHPARCAISPRASVGAESIRAALAGLIEDGSMRRLLTPFVDPARLKPGPRD